MTSNYAKVQGPAQPIWVPDGVRIDGDVTLQNSQTDPLFAMFPSAAYDSFGRARDSNSHTRKK